MDDFLFDNDYSNKDDEYELDAPYFGKLDDSFYDEKMYEKRSSQLKDTANSESPATDFWEQNPVNYYNEGLFEYQDADKQSISITNSKNKQRIIETKIGDKKETKDLTINFKVLTQHLIQQSACIQNVTAQEYQLFERFKKNKASLELFRELFGIIEIKDVKRQQNKSNFQESSNADYLRKILMEKLSQSGVIAKIMQNTRMQFHNKIICIKYLQVLRRGCADPKNFSSWKKN